MTSEVLSMTGLKVICMTDISILVWDKLTQKLTFELTFVKS